MNDQDEYLFLGDFGYSMMSMSEHKPRIVKVILDEKIEVKEL